VNYPMHSSPKEDAWLLVKSNTTVDSNFSWDIAVEQTTFNAGYSTGGS
jgi:hypothetical protein